MSNQKSVNISDAIIALPGKDISVRIKLFRFEIVTKDRIRNQFILHHHGYMYIMCIVFQLKDIIFHITTSLKTVNNLKTLALREFCVAVEYRL